MIIVWGGQEYWISWRSNTSVCTHINVRENWIFMKLWRDFKKVRQVVKISTQKQASTTACPKLCSVSLPQFMIRVSINVLITTVEAALFDTGYRVFAMFKEWLCDALLQSSLLLQCLLDANSVPGVMSGYLISSRPLRHRAFFTWTKIFAAL